MIIQIDQTLARRHIYSHSRICQIFPVSLIALERCLSNDHNTFSEKNIFEEAVDQRDQGTFICKYSGSGKDIVCNPPVEVTLSIFTKISAFLCLRRSKSA